MKEYFKSQLYLLLGVVLVIFSVIGFLHINDTSDDLTLTQEQQAITLKQNEINVREIVRLEQRYNTLFSKHNIVSEVIREISLADTTGLVAPILKKYGIQIKPPLRALPQL